MLISWPHGCDALADRARFCIEEHSFRQHCPFAKYLPRFLRRPKTASSLVPECRLLGGRLGMVPQVAGRWPIARGEWVLNALLKVGGLETVAL